MTRYDAYGYPCFPGSRDYATAEPERTLTPREPETRDPLIVLLDACECVVATAKGNTYGLTEADQLAALRMAAKYLEEALQRYKA